MTNYKILFLDIDGTTLTPDDTIQASTKDAIRQVKEKGLEVFLATGRPLHEIQDIAKELDIHSYIGYNGAYATYKGKDVLKEYMSPFLIEDYLKTAKAHHQEMVLYTSEQNAFTAPFEEASVKKFIRAFHLKQNTRFQEEMKHSILGITLLNVNKESIPLYEENYDLHLSQVNVEGLKKHYDVIRDNVNKGFAVEQILKQLGIPPQATIAFGDGMNDKEMLETAGEGFAMGNAHPDLFQYAKHRTTNVTDSGIYNGLKSLGLVK
ncbi:HAD family hydrolase [Heyndrickxia acidicola]|uniref:HAD family hydrolase n=1 Tax=Heyndrickxia acidicola TaxID=209389 RepID=A0ABU6MM00_9BACI|nr:HAD family hydrolase [Heyndrickxia acidicola]MED1205524.1 HAD family hydrolase [Heyndrickxia acidicola]